MLKKKEDVVHIYNGILLSHKKERNWVIYRDMDGSRDCHPEWSKKEKNKYCILTHICGTYKNGTDEWIMKMWYIYRMEYYSDMKRNEIGSFVETWMDLETVMQSEVSQKEKNKYHVLMHICGIWKNWYRRSYLQSRNRDTDVENKRMGVKGERGVWDELGDWDWDIYTTDTMYKIDN